MNIIDLYSERALSLYIVVVQCSNIMFDLAYPTLHIINLIIK